MVCQPDPIRRKKVLELFIAELKMAPRAGSSTKPRRPSQRNFAAAINRTRKDLDKLARAFAAGKIDLAEWRDKTLEAIESGHMVASALGRRRAGDPEPFTADDALRAMIVMREEGKYFARFVEAIEARDTRYVDEDGKLKGGAIASRSRQYLGRMRGTANGAFVGTSQPDDLFDRVMLTVEHCSTCPPKEGGPYTRTQVARMGYPGDGSDECGGNCGCVLVRYDGVVGFARPGEPAPRLTPGELTDDEEIPIIDLGPDDPRLEDWYVLSPLDKPVLSDGPGRRVFPLRDVEGITDSPRLPKPASGREYLDPDPEVTGAEMAEWIKDRNREVLVIVNPDGSLPFAPIVGDAGEVDVTTVRRHFKGRWILHNHPTGSAFSMDDLEEAIDTDSEGIVAMSPDGSVQVWARPEAGWPDLAEAKKAYRTAFSRALKARSGDPERLKKEIDRVLGNVETFGDQALRVGNVLPKWS